MTTAGDWVIRRRVGECVAGDAELGVWGEGVWEGEIGERDSLEAAEGELGQRARNSACFSLRAARRVETTWRIRGK